MKIILFFASMLGATLAFGSFDHYRVTDIGLPTQLNSDGYLFRSLYTNSGSASAVLNNPRKQYLYANGTFDQFSPPVGGILPTTSDWFGYGDIIPSDPPAKAGFYRNGDYHELMPDSGFGFNQIGARGASETKFLYGFEATGGTNSDLARGYLYNVDTGEKTIVPQLESKTYVTAALDTGVCCVSSSFERAGTNALAYLWKNGQYTMLGGSQWIPTALSRTEFVAGVPGGTAADIYIWHNGTLKGFALNDFVSVTGVSDKGDVSTYSADRNAAILVNMQGIAKIDDLVVNKPSNMTIYGASINFDGHMFGQAKVGNEHHFVLLDPVPEPATWLVVGLGAVVLIRRKARN